MYISKRNRSSLRAKFICVKWFKHSTSFCIWELHTQRSSYFYSWDCSNSSPDVQCNTPQATCSPHCWVLLPGNFQRALYHPRMSICSLTAHWVCPGCGNQSNRRPYHLLRKQDVSHDDVIKWKHFLCYWPFVWRIDVLRNEFRENTKRHFQFLHDDVIKWKPFPRYWPFVRGIHRSPVNSPHKGQWREALMLSLIVTWTNNRVNNRYAGDLRRHRAHYGVIVMCYIKRSSHSRYKDKMVKSASCHGKEITYSCE